MGVKRLAGALVAVVLAGAASGLALAGGTRSALAITQVARGFQQPVLVTATKAELADELLEAGGLLRLPGDLLDELFVGEHSVSRWPQAISDKPNRKPSRVPLIAYCLSLIAASLCSCAW